MQRDELRQYVWTAALALCRTTSCRPMRGRRVTWRDSHQSLTVVPCRRQTPAESPTRVLAAATSTDCPEHTKQSGLRLRSRAVANVRVAKNNRDFVLGRSWYDFYVRKTFVDAVIPFPGLSRVINSLLTYSQEDKGKLGWQGQNREWCL